MINALDRTPELPKYELIERIGLGGMATVYRARDRRLGREVAVKLIHVHLRENAEVRARFVSEARAVARLRHPNVVEVYDVSDEDEIERYLVAELVRGTTLRTLISKHGKLSPELSAAIGLEVAQGLAHAHSQGIIHRDVKPENVLVDLSGAASGPSEDSGARGRRARIKLTDFGIAKLLDAQGVTSTGQVLGSPAHMAPEQIEGGDVGPRADVFALGVMLYESMVGRLPFDGKNPAQVLRRVLEGVYPPADREERTVGARWAAIIARALVHDAAGRYESIEAFAAAIREELSRGGIGDPPLEIERFLADQGGYRAAFEPRLVEALVLSGERARAARDFSLAAAEFDRALAYRPGDADLVRRASRLARRVRFIRAGRMAVLGAIAATVATGLVIWQRRTGGVPVVALAKKVVRVGSAPAGSAALGSSPGPKNKPASKPLEGAGPKRRPPPLREAVRPPRPVEDVFRTVRVDVTGPKGGHLMIDGAREDQWFGKPFKLPVGPHTFEFVPADSECCLPSPPLSRVIEAGEVPDEVVLSVTFRDARLRLDKAPAGSLRCRALFAGDRAVPAGPLSIQMSQLSVTGRCVLTPEGASSSESISKRVTLTAGQTTEISFP